MKTLSVRFYKRLILVILLLLIVVPMIFAITLKAQNKELRSQLEASGQQQGKPLDLLAEPMEYQLLYPDLYGTAQIAEQRVRAANAVYLTFDCDLTDNTRQILNTLDQYGVRATFFVNGNTDPDALAVMKEIVDRGHSIGLRSYSDSYEEIYQSVGSYLEDFEKIYNLVYETTGVRAEIFRFPAGSVNAYNSGIYQELIAEMLRRNFIFFDWNVSGEDTQVGDLTAESVTGSVLSGMEGKERSIVLLRDTADKAMVTQALPGIIGELQNRGYSFQPLTAAVLPVVFSYKSAP